MIPIGLESLPNRRRGKPAASANPPSPEARYVLCLYIAGITARSSMAIANLKAICEEHLKGRYEQPSLAQRAQITASPTLIRRLPSPLRRIVGDMSRKDRILIRLDLGPRV